MDRATGTKILYDDALSHLPALKEPSLPVHTNFVALPSSEPDILDWLRKGSHYSEVRGELVHVIDCMTGNSVLVQHKDARAARLVPTPLGDGSLCWMQENLSVPTERTTTVPYSPLVLAQICQAIAEGGALTKICNGQGNMPTYSTFCNWRRKHSEVAAEIEHAREDRAENHRDNVLALAKATDEDNTESSKIKIDAEKWLAANDNQRYSPKAKLEATINVPTQILVHTGIVREKDVTPAPPTPEQK